ncbi:hypothetical protein EDB86DRAFT_2869880 [Lactarius hatsudake]|nr:hypothetical protein EDB86DRAFT_2869880 [Lactarius hatsudake]
MRLPRSMRGVGQWIVGSVLTCPLPLTPESPPFFRITKIEYEDLNTQLPVHPPKPFSGFHVVAPLVTACADA